jgi:hypothetical protein
MITNRAYTIDEVIREATDFDIFKEKPKMFISNGMSLVVMPVMARDHPDFLTDFYVIVAAHKEIFEKCSWLLDSATSKDRKKFSKLAIQFHNTKIYKHFVSKALPKFLSKWCYTLDIEIKEFVKLSKKQSKELIDKFEVDQLVEVFHMLFCFNYDFVKKNLEEITEKILSEMGEKHSTSTNISSKNIPSRLKSLPGGLLRKSDLKLIAQLSKKNIN